VLATIGGFLGVGPAFRFATGTEHPGGRLNIVTWLSPVIWSPAGAEGGEHGSQPRAEGTQEGVAAAEHGAAPLPEGAHAGAAGFNLAHSVEGSVHSELTTEWIFIVISLVAAATGMLLGGLFYVWRPALPDIWARRLRPLYLASYNKYWVDEFYGWAVTRRTMDAARAVFSFDSKVVDGIVNGLAALSRGLSRIVGGVDKYFVDGLVNSIAAFIVRLMSPLLRAAQTGFTQNYALMMVVGLMLAVAAFFARDIVMALRGVFAAIM